MAIFYLDIDDEITSAAARIRGTPDLVVVLVLPAGSRIATSRINFRLLAREAQQRSRRLSIVAPDAAARALAATAGLPVYASTMEYEASLPLPAEAGAAIRAPEPPAGRGASGPGAGRPAGAGPPAAGRPAGGAPSTGQAAAIPQGALESAAGTGFPPSAPHPGSARPGPTTGLGADRGTGPAPRPSHRRRNAALVGLLVLAFVGVAGGVAAYLLLPSASIVLSVHSVPIPPVSFVVTADPDVTATDSGAAVVPAIRLDLPLTASGTFKASGKRVDEAPAVGSVRWTNCDPTRSYTIPGGTPVRTAAGIAFGTDEAVFLPVAILNPPRIACQDRTVTVTAAKTGTGSNVAAGTITVIPGQYNNVVISVTNPAPTSGGKRTEFPKVTQKDVTGALTALGKQLDAQLVTAAAAPVGLIAGTTAYPETATRGTATATVDPATLVDQEVAQFDLGVTATGTVVAVDPAPILALGQARAAAAVPSDQDLVAGSAAVTVGPGTVDGQRVRFGVTARADAAPRIDEATLRRQVEGRSAVEAQAILGAFGDVTVTLWPGWASTIPTFDARVDLRIEGLAGSSPSSPPSMSPAPTASPAPTPSPAPALPSSPGPSAPAATSESAGPPASLAPAASPAPSGSVASPAPSASTAP